MTIPDADTAVPEQVRELTRGADLTPVWHNDYGGLTFRARGKDDFYVKWGPRNLEFSLRDEAERMRWASQWIRVPQVRSHGEDDTHEWLITTAAAVRA